MKFTGGKDQGRKSEGVEDVAHIYRYVAGLVGFEIMGLCFWRAACTVRGSELDSFSLSFLTR